MSDDWDPTAARRKLKAHPEMLACDALLDQTIFAGVGNIIKNEVLFRIRLHPLSQIGAMPSAKLTQLIKEARNYSFDFLEWKKAYVLKKHWLAHTKSRCPRCDVPLVKAHLGRSNRRSFFCNECQVLHALEAAAPAAVLRAPATARAVKKPLAGAKRVPVKRAAAKRRAGAT